MSLAPSNNKMFLYVKLSMHFMYLHYRYHSTFCSVYELLFKRYLNIKGCLQSTICTMRSLLSMTLHNCLQNSKFFSYGVTTQSVSSCSSAKSRLQSRKLLFSASLSSSGLRPVHSGLRGIGRFLSSSVSSRPPDSPLFVSI